MLERVEVDGFKSLRSFQLDIKPGLNILVGPNGAGKSNVILFLEFLSHLASSSAMQAVSLVGGAGSVFSLVKTGVLKNKLEFGIRGAGLSRGRIRSGGERREMHFTYEYRATIALSPILSSLSFTKQELTLHESESEQGLLDFGKDRPSLRISWKLTDSGPVIEEAATANDDIFVPYFLHRDGNAKKFDFADFLSGFSDELRDYSIFRSLGRFIEPLELIHDDLVEGRALNIDPNSVRQGEDIASQPGIRPDGAGLAATLFYAKKRLERPQRHGLFRVHTPYDAQSLPKNLVASVERYTRLINDNFVRLDIEGDTFENKIRVLLVLKSAHEASASEISVPISLASDGTAKWLALVTAILSRTSAFAIEEPENFLHPHMQTETVELVRNACNKKHSRMFALMTTHSETLLNSVRPEEVIVVSMHDGKTKATRPINIDELKREISETGFGLGYFYLAGALS